jgi:nitroreductase
LLRGLLMDVMDAIRARYSCRAYLDKPIEKDKLHRVMEAARLAPSAKNLQDWRFVVASEKQTKRRLAEAANNQMFIADAGAIIVACSVSDHVMRCGQPVASIDVAIAIEHICLEAVELGLGTCWIGSFYPDQVRPIIGIPPRVVVIELLALGYPAEPWRPPRRELPEKIFCFETWAFQG